MNSALGIIAAGKSNDWREAVAMACEAINSGAARRALQGLREESAAS